DGFCGKLDKAKNLDASLEKPLTLIREAKVLLREAAGYFSCSDQADPNRLEEIESRLFLIHQLKKKHGGSLGEVLSKAQTFRDELKNLENLEDVLVDRRKELKILGEKVLSKAAELSETRKKKARLLSKAVEKELADLSMPGVKFHVSLSHPEMPTVADCGADGFDKVRFDLSANAGEAPKPLSQIASGGELSRIFLAIKKVLGESAPMTLIFDEIDSGIGGGVAEVVGRKLKEMAGQDQVLVVTHLPQVASQADTHYVIEKGKSGDRTRTRVKVLETASERETEIARMLAGVEISDKARAHAREMLKKGAA
ncbi:MAG: DNA repair protein RecN, partial [Deltaproteobacteria bacterium]|nr:DNA repair protein RecN [Deltaproteobacteria bacterium]